jgi:putative ABC transport system permease protein
MWSSFRIAVRSLARRPAVVAIATVSLAVGIGVNSAVFSIVDAVFLRPPAVANPDSLVFVTAQFKDSGSGILDWSDSTDIAAEAPAFAAVTATMSRGGLWRNGDEMTPLLVDAVGDNYFEMLGVKPFLGRLPDSRYDYAADSEPPIVLAWWLWHERMGARPDVIGRQFEYRDHVWRIAGILPPQFRGVNSMDQTHVWIPVSSWARYFRNDLNRGGGQFQAIARLRSGASVEQAQAQLDLLAKRIEAADSRVAKGRRLAATSIAAELRSSLRPGILVLAVVSLVLLVACANVAAVLLANAESRRREIGLRLSLGAGRLALLRQFLTESVVLALLGTGAGLLLAAWLLTIVPALAPPTFEPFHYDFRMDLRVFLFTGTCSLITLAIFGLAPLTYALRVWPAEAISGARTAGRSPRPLLRNCFVIAQVALSVVLVGGAVVLARALADARRIYPGYDTTRPLALITASVGSRTPSEDLLFREAAGRVASVSGVETVTWARHVPLVSAGSGAAISVTPEGASPDAPPPRIYFNLVGPKFFEVTGARMLSGRVFADSDHHGGAPTAIINAEAARRFWPGQNPIGKILRTRTTAFEVIGVAADGRIGALHEKPAPVLYLPSTRIPWGETILIARTRTDPAPIVKELARAAAQTRGLRIFESMTLRTLMTRALYDDWIPTVLGGFLAAIGLLLAAGGLYGAASHATQRRLGEFGVRMAVGARARQIAGLVLRHSLFLCAAGVPPGVGLFVAIYHYQAAALLGHRPMDSLAVCLGTAITIVSVLAGTVLPALRAARLDPVQILRSE